MKRIRATLLVLAAPALLLLAVELGLRAAGAAWARLYPLLSRTESFPMYVVGESTAFGLPFAPKISFPKTAAMMLGDQVRGRPLELVVLARPGSQTEDQYWRLLQELSLRPRREGLVLVYIGVNETLRETPSALEKAVDRSIILSRLSYMVRGPRGEIRALDYERRLAKIVALARARGLPVVLSTLAGNVRDFSPAIQRHILDDPVRSPRYERARRLEKLGRWSEASGIYESLLRRDLPDAGLLHRLAVCALRSGRPAEAKALFQESIDRGGAKRPTAAQNRAIRRVAGRLGAALSDSQAIFEAASPLSLSGAELFLDAHHPNIRGTLLLAGGAARQISRLLNTPVVRPRISESELKEESGFSEEDERGVHLLMFMWFCGEAGHGADREESLSAARRHLEQAERRSGRPEAVRRFVLALAEKDRAAAERWLAREDQLTRDQGALASIACNPLWIWRTVEEAGLSERWRAEAERLILRVISQSRCGPRPSADELRSMARAEGSGAGSQPRRRSSSNRASASSR